jgi:hypothetical protein
MNVIFKLQSPEAVISSDMTDKVHINAHFSLRDRKAEVSCPCHRSFSVSPGGLIQLTSCQPPKQEEKMHLLDSSSLAGLTSTTVDFNQPQSSDHSIIATNPPSRWVSTCWTAVGRSSCSGPQANHSPNPLNW